MARISEFTKEELLRLFVDEKLNILEVSKKIGVDRKALKKFVVENNIEVYRVNKKINADELYNYYILENHSIADTAKHFGIAESTLKLQIKQNGFVKAADEVVELRRKTLIEKYGVESPLQNKEFIDKQKETYKNRTTEDKAKTLEKRKKSCIEKFGVDNPLKSNEIKEKFIATNLNKRGVCFPTQALEVRQKVVQTVKDRYGVDNVSQVAEVKEKRTQTIFNQYGVKNYGEIVLPESVRNLINDKDSLIEYVKESGLRTIYDISNKIGCSYSTLVCRFREYDLWYLLDSSRSHYETEISNLLDEMGVKHYKTRSILNSKLEIDLYCPDYNIGIEFNGDYFHCSLNKPKNYHFDKSLDAQRNNKRLIHIYEYEWNDDVKRPIIISLLRIAFGKIDNRIYARNCEVRQISNKEARDFNNQNHLQGHRNAEITYGLFYEDKLVQLMSFSKHKKYQWEIIRGCPGSNNIVVGGVSKLFTHFVRENSPEQVFSYCDFNKFDGKGYEALGMEFIGYTGPDMKWLMKDGTVVGRNPVKHKEYSENAKAKIWGSGSKKYLWTKEKSSRA